MTPILALDLGCKTGYALETEATGVMSGTWRLDKWCPVCPFDHPKADSLMLREWRLFWLVRSIVGAALFAGGVVAYEDVQFSVSTLQTQHWAGFRSSVLTASRLAGISDFRPVPVPTLKKIGAGHGAATKEMMSQAWVRKNPGCIIDQKKRVVHPNGKVADDNEVDALHLLTHIRSLKP